VEVALGLRYAAAMKPLVIVGAGGHGRVVLDAAEAMFALTDGNIAGFIDENVEGPVNG
jgi:hypothetical protein